MDQGRTGQNGQALKHVLLSGLKTHYVLKRSSRKSIGLRITPEGLSVSAPHRLPVHVIENLLLEKSAWILKKLEEAKPHPAQQWIDGEKISYLGQAYELRTGQSNKRSVALSHEGIEVRMPAPSPEETEAMVGIWYRKRALECFSDRIEHYCEKLGLIEPRLFLSNAKTRWGSCNSKREVRLNWRLVKLPIELVDYVVVHELSHLVELNHSRAFWETVGRAYPDYRRARQELKRIRLW
jgi:predicted metal-dependent hydrolase